MQSHPASILTVPINFIIYSYNMMVPIEIQIVAENTGINNDIPDRSKYNDPFALRE